MVIPMEYTHFGYDYLDKVNTWTIHSGVDLNKGRPYDDLGEPILAMAKGEVVFAKDCGKGWGRMIVLYHSAYGCWSRYAHLDSFNVIHGKKVEEGDEIGTCGASGGTWAPHLHWDVIIKELSKWTKYTSWWSKDKVRKYYADPIKYVNESNYLEKKEEPIVKWHKKHHIIEKWSDPPTKDELKLAWAIYKALRANKYRKIEFDV